MRTHISRSAMPEWLLRQAVSRAADEIRRGPEPYFKPQPLTARRIANRVAKNLGLTRYLRELAEEELERRRRREAVAR